MSKVKKMTKMKIPASHNKSGYIIRYFCPQCGGDMDKCGYDDYDKWQGDYQCMECGYEENIEHYRKNPGKT